VKKTTTVEELLVAQCEMMKDMFIAELAIAGIPQREIARVVHVDLNRVTRLTKSLKRRKADANGDD
jgi:3-methyladenine DNA glycosylase AlkD